MSNEAAHNQNNRPGSALPTGNSWFGVLMELYRVNEQYIQEVVDASRRILQIVLDALVPGDNLKHTPVRTCFRILSGMIFILKVCYLVQDQVLLVLTNIGRHSRLGQKKMMSGYPWIFKIGSLKLSGPGSSTMSI